MTLKYGKFDIFHQKLICYLENDLMMSEIYVCLAR